MVKGVHIFTVYSLFIAHVPLTYSNLLRLPSEIRDPDAFRYVDLLIKITFVLCNLFARLLLPAKLAKI